MILAVMTLLKQDPAAALPSHMFPVGAGCQTPPDHKAEMNRRLIHSCTATTYENISIMETLEFLLPSHTVDKI